VSDFEIVCSAPGRSNLIGNPTDIYGGSVVSCTVELRARVRLTPWEGTRLVAPAADGAGEESLDVRGAGDLALRGDRFDLGRVALASLGGELPRCRIAWSTAIPLESGLAGSTALLVALWKSLLALRGESPSPWALAEQAREIERRKLEVVCGFGDHYMSVFGGLCYLDFRGKGGEEPASLQPWATIERLGELGEAPPFLLAVTGVRHFSGSVHGPIRKRWLAGEPGVRSAYARVAELGRLGKRALLERDWPRLGALMNENHAIQRGLGGSGDSNERLVAAALTAGAPGAKLAGAGHGGTVLVLWPDADARPIESALRAAGAAAFHRPRAVEGARFDVLRGIERPST
jgi:galactokinase/mevalonate kinase-like predicted kinase